MSVYFKDSENTELSPHYTGELRIVETRTSHKLEPSLIGVLYHKITLSHWCFDIPQRTILFFNYALINNKNEGKSIKQTYNVHIYYIYNAP